MSGTPETKSLWRFAVGLRLSSPLRALRWRRPKTGIEAGSLPAPPAKWYRLDMKSETTAVLDAFEALSPEEKRFVADEILRRLPLDSGPLSDEELDAAGASLFAALDREDADAHSR